MIRSGVLSFAVVGSFMIAGCGGSGPTTTGGEEVATTEAALSTNTRSALFYVPASGSRSGEANRGIAQAR